MSEEKLKAYEQEINNYRELFKQLFLIFIAVLSGIVTIFYKVLTQEIEIYMLILATIGFILSSILAFLIKKIWIKLETLIKELKNE